jgi:hypothetical protein
MTRIVGHYMTLFLMLNHERVRNRNRLLKPRLLEEEVPTELKVLLDLDLVTPTSLINTPLKIPPPAALVEGVSLG